VGGWGANVQEASPYSKRNRTVNVKNLEGKNLDPLIFLLFRADSVTWNPHKLLGVPQQCSTFLTRHADLLLEANSASASYLFQKDKFYDPKWDVGDKYLQCGRRADVLKFWFMWQAKVDFSPTSKRNLNPIMHSCQLCVVYQTTEILNKINRLPKEIMLPKTYV
jgi:hypothetical protein